MSGGGGDKSKAYLVSFGDTRLGISICRFKQQAETLGVFDNVFIYTEASLPLDFVKDFENKFYTYKSGIKTPIRGFDYWSCKPKVILMALEQINFGDYLIYCDIGFEFNAKAKSDLQRVFKDIQEQELLGVITQHKERCWNKADLLAHFNLLEDESFLDSRQVAAGAVFMKKCEKTIKIIEEWLAYFYHSYPLIDDSPSKIPNLKEFKENRYDQSIWSILNKRYKLKNYDYADFSNQNRCLLYNRNKIYLPVIVEPSLKGLGV